MPDDMDLIKDQVGLPLYEDEPEPEPELAAPQPEPPPVTSFRELPPPEPPPPNQQEMDTLALVFLDDPLARKLAIAWRACGGNEKHWLEAAGIERTLFADAHRLCSALRMNGICRDGGVTDDVALRYIGSLIQKTIMTKGKPNDRPKR